MSTIKLRSMQVVLVLSWVALPRLWGQGVPVSPGAGPQENPVVSGSLIAWHEFNRQRGDYDVFVADFNRPDDPLVLTIVDSNEQMNPALWADRLVWQEYTLRRDSQDWDIFVADLSGLEEGDVWVYPVSNILYNDEQHPAIHGNIVVWQDGPAENGDIYGADITYLDAIREFPIATFDGNQVAPVVWRDQVLWLDDTYGDWDIFGSDIWLQDLPQEFPIASQDFEQIQVAMGRGIAVWQDNTYGDWDIVGLDLTDFDSVEYLDVQSRPADQTQPAVDGPWVVYQDNRNGHWDIYATHWITGNEIRVTRDPADQVNPVISGRLVVWQDNQSGTWTIYAKRLPEEP
ncbi:hypothetical protein ACFL6U_30330 [Planctomycetota bacterium]